MRVSSAQSHRTCGRQPTCSGTCKGDLRERSARVMIIDPARFYYHVMANKYFVAAGCCAARGAHRRRQQIARLMRRARYWQKKAGRK